MITIVIYKSKRDQSLNEAVKFGGNIEKHKRVALRELQVNHMLVLPHIDTVNLQHEFYLFLCVFLLYLRLQLLLNIHIGVIGVIIAAVFVGLRDVTALEAVITI
jgi:hypothetical protein